MITRIQFITPINSFAGRDSRDRWTTEFDEFHVLVLYTLQCHIRHYEIFRVTIMWQPRSRVTRTSELLVSCQSGITHFTKLYSRVKTISLSCFFFITEFDLNSDNFSEQSCSTPTSTNGECIVITKCNSLLTLLRKNRRTQQETQFLRNSQCGTEGRNPKVCCEIQAQPAGGGTSSTCTTTEGTAGDCKDIYQCPALLTLFNAPKPLSQNVETRLRQSSCQGPARFSVCCGKPTSRNPSNVDALLPKDSECGRSGDQDRIFGGNETAIDQYPWMALVEYRTRRNTLSLSCAASLISKRYLVTAGHCVTGDIVSQVGTP